MVDFDRIMIFIINLWRDLAYDFKTSTFFTVFKSMPQEDSCVKIEYLK